LDVSAERVRRATERIDDERVYAHTTAILDACHGCRVPIRLSWLGSQDDDEPWTGFGEAGRVAAVAGT
jgi:hypothetical protein